MVAKVVPDIGLNKTFRVSGSVRVPNEKRVWDAVVVDGVYGETFGQ
jgi:hypothetical protein